jgi:hypothetical protein
MIPTANDADRTGESLFVTAAYIVRNTRTADIHRHISRQAFEGEPIVTAVKLKACIAQRLTK